MKIKVNSITMTFRTIIASSLVLVGLVIALSVTKPSYAATTNTVTFDNATQVAWFWGPRPYNRDYYRWHHWSRWYPGVGYGCQRRCLHNNWTGAVVRCEQICR